MYLGDMHHFVTFPYRRRSKPSQGLVDIMGGGRYRSSKAENYLYVHDSKSNTYWMSELCITSKVRM